MNTSTTIILVFISLSAFTVPPKDHALGPNAIFHDFIPSSSATATVKTLTGVFRSRLLSLHRRVGKGQDGEIFCSLSFWIFFFFWLLIFAVLW
ncbi:hypothetical protein B0J18DRAFT_438080 [Chaetomium sp. MPI-SDFR-AT-0129]|nr:hypothetical protein B0J18DRAFT_438080 [Chaetomium sp. MPI-SDFR-AT-0129]